MRPIAFALFLLLFGCRTYDGIDTETVSRCPNFAGAKTFRVEYADTPSFLVEYLRLATNGAFEPLGMHATDGDADLVLDTKVTQLDDEQRVIHADDFEGHLESGGNRTFTAVLDITVRERDGAPRCQIRLSRIHHTAPGAYMHEGRAVAALRDALREAMSL